VIAKETKDWQTEADRNKEGLVRRSVHARGTLLAQYPSGTLARVIKTLSEERFDLSVDVIPLVKTPERSWLNSRFQAG